MTSTEVYATTDEFFANINFSAVPKAAEVTKAENLLAAASRTIDGWANRKDGFIAPVAGVSRDYAGNGTPLLDIDPCVEVTSVAVKEAYNSPTFTAWAATEYLPFSGDPESPSFGQTPFTGLMVSATGDETIFTSGRSRYQRGSRPSSTDLTPYSVPTVRVVARWGLFAAITSVPNLREATIFQAAIWYKRLESSAADTLASADFGTLRFRKSIDPAVIAMIDTARLRIPSIG